MATSFIVTKRHCELHHAALLAHQPLLGLGLLLQHMVEEQHGAVLDLVDRPGRRLQAAADAVERGRREKKMGTMV